ncbi:radical SAM protein [Pantanalinema sp. GBBB05]|uniref:radical SAM protein n=1 Tax=Pantanalinema sp. GBBB05 TaxID=2604139 RepID=UPI003D81472F
MSTSTTAYPAPIDACLSPVYGPVESWRFGRSLGIDPIGLTSTCTFDCVYCQLGGIDQKTCDRQIFTSTARILWDLQFHAPWHHVDVITLSGSGEPTLALNLGTILSSIKALISKPVIVLTNGSLLQDPDVQAELAIADQVAIKVDAISAAQFRSINRSLPDVDLLELWLGIEEFRQGYQGYLAIQTMMLAPWNDYNQSEYIRLMRELAPDEIQLNTPTRPRPLAHQPDARGNQVMEFSYPVQSFRPVSAQVLREFGDRIYHETHIPVRWAINS